MNIKSSRQLYIVMLGNIYKITPHNCDEFYIGSTTDMKIRELRHNKNSKISTIKVYVKIREMGGFNMELLYVFECEDETELRMEEQRCMDKLKPTLNSIRAFNTEEDTILIKKQYYQENKDHLRDKQRQYNEQNKDHLRDKQRQYYQENRDVISEYKKQYDFKNRDVLREKITCVCGCDITRTNLNRHQKSSKHINLMEQQQTS